MKHIKTYKLFEGHTCDTIKSIIMDAAADMSDDGYNIELYGLYKNEIAMTINSSGFEGRLGYAFRFKDIIPYLIEILSQLKEYDAKLGQIKIESTSPTHDGREVVWEYESSVETHKDMSLDDIRKELNEFEMSFYRWVDDKHQKQVKIWGDYYDATEKLCHVVVVNFTYDEEGRGY